VLEIFALFMLLGCFSTLLIKETKRKTLEELSGDEDAASFTSSNMSVRDASSGGEGGVMRKEHGTADFV
jgi:PHS family inorganic phosphate transporter-like MFS transporter